MVYGCGGMVVGQAVGLESPPQAASRTRTGNTHNRRRIRTPARENAGGPTVYTGGWACPAQAYCVAGLMYGLNYKNAILDVRRGRPRKFSRPARTVTLTLPDDVIERLSGARPRPGRAVVRLTLSHEPQAAASVVDVATFGGRAVILVPPARRLAVAARRRAGPDRRRAHADRARRAVDRRGLRAARARRARGRLAHGRRPRAVRRAGPRAARGARRDPRHPAPHSRPARARRVATRRRGRRRADRHPCRCLRSKASRSPSDTCRWSTARRCRSTAASASA